jgi:hypothetical protein
MVRPAPSRCRLTTPEKPGTSTSTWARPGEGEPGELGRRRRRQRGGAIDDGAVGIEHQPRADRSARQTGRGDDVGRGPAGVEAFADSAVAGFESFDEALLGGPQDGLGRLATSLLVDLAHVDDGDHAEARHEQRRQQHQRHEHDEDPGEADDVVAARGHGDRRSRLRRCVVDRPHRGA